MIFLMIQKYGKKKNVIFYLFYDWFDRTVILSLIKEEGKEISNFLNNSKSIYSGCLLLIIRRRDGMTTSITFFYAV